MALPYTSMQDLIFSITSKSVRMRVLYLATNTVAVDATHPPQDYCHPMSSPSPSKPPADICGPLNGEAPGGFRSYVAFTDNFSRFTKVFLLKSKTKEELHVDSGDEFVNSTMIDFCKAEGVEKIARLILILTIDD
ncbi:hypothetical protein Dda_4001 [Drechslerella dactyloides]|uniref:Uncharacterized protein n=1 Tax=Drechslerella dactyloides TaxID=74499 RepID=A0AAD6IZT2_DREDA|nr:hypothetical protein Dda_4001 [Drechslerella dactyloides]